MASKKRIVIDMIAEHLFPPLPEAIKDVSNNDHYKPKDDIVDNLSVIVEKNENEIFVLRYAYQIKTDLKESENWINL